MHNVKSDAGGPENYGIHFNSFYGLTGLLIMTWLKYYLKISLFSKWAKPWRSFCKKIFHEFVVNVNKNVLCLLWKYMSGIWTKYMYIYSSDMFFKGR